MKIFNAHRIFLSFAVLFTILSIAFINPTNAQDAIQFKGGSDQVQYSADELELLRSKLLELVATVKDFSETLRPGDVQSANNLSLARTQIEQYSTKQLNDLEGRWIHRR